MLTLTEVKAHLRVDHDHEDTLINSLIEPSYQFAEEYTGRSVLPVQKVLNLDNFQSLIELPVIPVVSIENITYNDTDGALQTLTEYYLDLREQRATLQAAQNESFPGTDETFENVTITYSVGYSVIPSVINQAVLLIIGSLYEQRENHIIGVPISKVPVAAEYLLATHRVVTV